MPKNDDPAPARLGLERQAARLAAGADAMTSLAAGRSRWRRVERVGRRLVVRRASPPACRRASARQIRLERREHAGGRDEPQLDRVVELQLGLLAQVLDRARQLARVALCAQLVVERPCRSPRPGPRRGRRPCPAAAWRGSRPRPRRGHAGQADAAVRQVLDLVVACRREHVLRLRRRAACRSWAAAA